MADIIDIGNKCILINKSYFNISYSKLKRYHGAEEYIMYHLFISLQLKVMLDTKSITLEL